MKKLTAVDPETKSPDLVAENIERLKALFPELFTEGPDGASVNVDVLKQLVGDKTVADADEKYGLNWHGKRRARQLALTPSTGTLRPAPEDSVDWDTTQNLMIEGDNLEVLKLLQKSYAGKVKLIYIDPPYNTGKDFVYPDNFKDNIRNYMELTGQVEGGTKISSNTEASGRFHTDWLNMMYPRLKLARTLLANNGVVCISIDDNEITRLRAACDEIFGEENHVTDLIWKSKSGGANDSEHFAVDHEYVAVYAKLRSEFRLERDPEAEVTTSYNRKDDTGEYSLDRLDKQSIRYSPSLDFDIVGPDGTRYRPAHKNPDAPNASWRWSSKKIAAEYDKLVFEKGFVYTKNYRSDGAVPRSLLTEERFGRTRTGKTECASLMEGQVFDNPKPTRLIGHLIRVAAAEESHVLDFFAGSGTTGHAVMAQNAADGGNRRYILVQLPEPLDPENKDQKFAADFCDELGKPRNIAELTKERLRRAAKKIRDESPLLVGDLGFRVFKLDSSNIHEWEPDRDNLHQTLLDSIDHLKADRTEQDILYELLLKLGLDLCVPIETRTVAGKAVHSIGGGVLLACLATRITQEEVEPLAQGIVAWHKELAPASDTTCVFRDSAFADDVAKTNLAAILEQHDLKNVRSL